MTTPSRTVRGACNLCEAICGLLVTVEDTAEGERVTGIRGNPADPLSRGHLCPKGTALADLHADPDRLRRPVRRVRTPEGDRWEEVGWDEAIEAAVDGLAAVVERHGRDAVAVYLGNPNVHSLGSMTHASQVVKAVGSRNTFSATSVDQLPQQLVAYLLLGHQLLVPVPDIDRTSYFLVLGANPMASNGSLMTAPDFPNRVRALKARNGRMVVLDPRRTETAKVADEHHFVRPGTDPAVLLAMVRTILEEHEPRVPAYVDGVPQLREAVAPFTPERAEELSGVPAAVVRRIARELMEADSAVVYGRMGVSTHPFGTVCAWAVTCLNVLTGNLDREGGAMLTSPAVDIVGRRIVGRGGHGRWRSRVRDLPESGGELPVATMADEMLTPGDGQVRAALVLSGNPVLSTPDGKRLDQAMAGLDFAVAVDVYLNETTRHADVVLPPTTILERDHYDLVFHALAVRNTARFTPAVLVKSPDARHDWQVYRDLALGLAARTGRRGSLRQRVVREGRLRLSPTRLLDLLLRTATPRLSVARLRARPDGIDLGPLRAGLLPGRLATPGKRVELAQPLVLRDLSRLDQELSAPRGPGELLLIGRRHQRDNNSWMHNTERLTKGRRRHQLFMHPSDLASRALRDGQPVEVSSRVGTVTVEVRATDEMMPGVVSLPHGYGHARNPGMARAATVPGVSVNDLTDPERLDVSGNAAFSGLPVTVTAGRPQSPPATEAPGVSAASRLSVT